MQVVELADAILALSLEVLVGIILVQPLKATSGETTTWLGSHGVVAVRKLHCLARPTHLGVSAPVEKPRDADEKTGGLRLGGQKDQIRSPN